MGNIFNSNDWIIIFLKIVIVLFLVSSILILMLFGLIRMIKEKTFLVELNGMETISPFFCLAGAVVSYSLLFAYENPNFVVVAVLQGFCSILCLLGLLGITLVQLRFTR